MPIMSVSFPDMIDMHGIRKNIFFCLSYKPCILCFKQKPHKVCLLCTRNTSEKYSVFTDDLYQETASASGCAHAHAVAVGGAIYLKHPLVNVLLQFVSFEFLFVKTF